MNFSEEQILSMAPDDSSKKSGKELANPSKWVKREFSDRALWGECQGSGKLPYQAQVDLVNVAFKCSCPSRKFPCKHGLGLLLLYARDRKLFSTGSEPNWVTEWLDKRNDREDKKTEKKEKDKKVDPASQAKRQEARVKRVEDGMSELRMWLYDIIRNGLINIPGKDSSYFENIAKRMVDAQAPGLAGMIRGLGNTNFFQDGWQSPFLDQLIRIYLVIEGFSRLDSITSDLQDEIRTLVGFTQNQDELKAADGIRDAWFVLGRRTDKEENLTTERNWLYGTKSKRHALVLQFFVKGQLPEVNLVTGSTVDAELVFFKGANSNRALVKNQFAVATQTEVRGCENWNEALVSASDSYAVDPWDSNLPVIVENVVPQLMNHQIVLRDVDGNGIFVDSGFTQGWKLMALSGGKPLRVFSIGKELSCEPMGAWVNNQYVVLS